jgi:hypothetical protein
MSMHSNVLRAAKPCPNKQNQALPVLQQQLHRRLVARRHRLVQRRAAPLARHDVRVGALRQQLRGMFQGLSAAECVLEELAASEGRRFAGRDRLYQ